MQKYTITNKDIQRTTIEYSLSNNTPVYPNSADEGNGFLEFYMNTPHNFVNNERISVNFKSINLANDTPVSLRPRVMIGLALGDETKPPKYLWCYENDTTLWYEIFEIEIKTYKDDDGNDIEFEYINEDKPINPIKVDDEEDEEEDKEEYTNGILYGYRDSIETPINNSSRIDDDETAAEWNETFRTFRITISSDGKKIKELHSNTEQHLTSNPITLDCGIFSGISIAYTCTVPDTYFRIPYIDLKRNVNIIRSGWDNERENFIITTDHGYDHSEGIWIDKLRNVIADEYELCMNVAYNRSFYIPQSNDALPVIGINELFSYHDELITTTSNDITYCELSITLIEPPCFENAIEYDFILNNNKTGIQRLELNCAGGDYIKDGICDIIFNNHIPAIGRVTIFNGVVTGVTISDGGRGYVNTYNITFDNIDIDPTANEHIIATGNARLGETAETADKIIDVIITNQGRGYKNGVYDIRFNGNRYAEGYFTVKDRMVMDVVLTEHGVYQTAPDVDLTNGGGEGAWATAIMFKDDFSNISEMFLRYKKEYLTFYKSVANYAIKINMSQDYTLDTMRTDLLKKFIEVETKKAINPILDNERVRFEPVFRAIRSSDNRIMYFPINRLKYQFSFKGSGNNITKLLELGFTDNDVLYKKKALSRTFCRQSFYNNFNPTQYKLECFNSVFVNIDSLYTNYILSINNISDNPINGIPMLDDNMNVEFDIFNPLLEKFTNAYGRDGGKTTTVEYNQSSSSEGYYLYLFGEEYKQLDPLKLYMKMEFNNARTGKRTLFFNRENEGVPLNNIFFKQGNIRQFMYTEIMVCGVKVIWNNINKFYRQLTNEEIKTGDPFELKYFWYPVLGTYPSIQTDISGGVGFTRTTENNDFPNIIWGDKIVNNLIEYPDNLTIKFYEADVK